LMRAPTFDIVGLHYKLRFFYIFVDKDPSNFVPSDKIARNYLNLSVTYYSMNIADVNSEKRDVSPHVLICC